MWTVDDLVSALEEEVGPSEVRGLLKPGRVESGLEALLWERDHGRPKRVAVIAELIVRRGWELQVGLTRGGVLPARCSPLTKEAIAVLVEDGLLRAQVIGGADLAEIEEALRRLEVGVRCALWARGMLLRAVACLGKSGRSLNFAGVMATPATLIQIDSTV